VDPRSETMSGIDDPSNSDSLVRIAEKRFHVRERGRHGGGSIGWMWGREKRRAEHGSLVSNVRLQLSVLSPQHVQTRTN